jgi:hypothetical protein
LLFDNLEKSFDESKTISTPILNLADKLSVIILFLLRYRLNLLLSTKIIRMSVSFSLLRRSEKLSEGAIL